MSFTDRKILVFATVCFCLKYRGMDYTMGRGLEYTSVCKVLLELYLADNGNEPFLFCFRIVHFYSKNIILRV